MQTVADRAAAPAAIQTDLRAIFVSLELSRSTWLITSLSPGGVEMMSMHSVSTGAIVRSNMMQKKVRVNIRRRSPQWVLIRDTLRKGRDDQLEDMRTCDVRPLPIQM